jgi:hypothetical protein
MTGSFCWYGLVGGNRAPLTGANLREVWSGENQNDCVITCKQLRNAKIPYKLVQHNRQFFKGVDEHYEIGVPPKFCKQAEAIIDSGRLNFMDKPSDQAIMELPAQDDMADATEVDKEPDSYKWKPENACYCRSLVSTEARRRVDDRIILTGELYQLPRR